ncbi:MAG: hypothetical protein Q8P90_04360 [bacterium]|nr:hypothetical protein [bacterium]
MEPGAKIGLPKTPDDPREFRERILERVVLVCPRNDAESQTITHLAERLGMTVITSDQKHGATLDKEPDLSNKLSATQKQEVWIIEIPNVEIEEALRVSGLELEVIDHHRYGSLDRTQASNGRALPSSLEQFMARTHITDTELMAWGYDPKTVRGIGIMDHGFVQGLRNHQYDQADIARVIEFRQQLAAEIDPQYPERVIAAEQDWAQRREQDGFMVVESTQPYDARTFISEAAMKAGLDTKPVVISVNSGAKIYVQNINPAGVPALIEHYKGLVAEPRLAFGFGSNCMGVDNTGNPTPVLMAAVLEQAKSFIG